MRNINYLTSLQWSRGVFAILMTLFSVQTALAQWSIPSTNSKQTITFDAGLSGVNTGTFAAPSTYMANSTSGTLVRQAWAVQHISSTAVGICGCVVADTATRALRYGVAAGNANGQGASNGSNTTGGFHAYDVANGGPTNVAFGIRPTGSVFAGNSGSFVFSGNVGLKFVNTTGTAISKIVVGYRGYVRNSGPRGNSLNLYYAEDNTNGSYAIVPGAGLRSPDAADGTPIWVSNNRFATLNVSIAAGDSAYLKWVTKDQSGSSNRDQFAIDDIFIVANPGAPTMTLTETSPILTGGSYAFGSTNVSTNIDKTFTIGNTTASSTLVTGQPTITGANASEFTLISNPYGAAINGPAGTSTFSVRFTPASSGTRNAVLTIPYNDGTSYTVNLSGVGNCVDPVVNLSATASSVTEGASVTYTLTASSNIASDATFRIDTVGAVTRVNNYAFTGLTVPARTVTMLAGTNTISFTVATTDNNFNDGARSINLQYAIVSGPVCAGTSNLSLTVNDNDQTISLTSGMLNNFLSPYQENFNTLGNVNASLNTLVPTGVYFREDGINGNSTYSVDNGGSTTGNTYSYGTTNASDRAFGSLNSGSFGPQFIGFQFTNNTGSDINGFRVQYNGEVWRRSTSTTDKLEFEYSTDATSLSTGTWSAFNTYDFTPSTQTSTPLNAGAVDGNLAANRAQINQSSPVNFADLAFNVLSGGTFWIRFKHTQTTSADGIAIDDFRITPTFTPPVIYYSRATGFLNQTSTWTSSPSGVGGTEPSDFTANNATYFIRNRTSGSLNTNWTVTGTGSKVVVENSGTTFTIPNNLAFNGTVDVVNGATLDIQGNVVPTFGTLGASSTVRYANVFGSVTVTGLTSPGYGNLVFANSGVKFVDANNYLVRGNISFDGANVSRTTLVSGTINFGGNITLGAQSFFQTPFTSQISFTTSANSSNQVINTNGNVFTCFNLTSTNKTGGSLQLTGAGTIIQTVNSFTLSFVSPATFNDNGNTVRVGNNLELDGTAGQYTLTGTFEMNGSSGTQNIRNNNVGSGAPVPTINNLVIATTGTGLAQLNPTSGSATNVTIAGNFTVNAGSNIRLGNSSGTIANTLTVNGAVVVNGNVNFPGNLIKNTGNVSGTGFIENLNITGNAVSILNGSNLRIRRLLTVADGGVLNNTAGGSLVLAATTGRTAALAPVGTGVINGSLTQERNISTVRKTSAGTFVYVSSPFSNSTVATYGPATNNTFATQTFEPVGTSTTSSVWFFDKTQTTAGGRFTGNGWAKPVATTDAIGVGQGLGVFFRASPFFNGGGLLKATGTPNTGTVALPVTYCASGCATQGWNLVGNPFPATINFRNSGWTYTNVDQAYYAIRYATASGGVINQYASYTMLDSTNGASRFIAPFQGFMVNANAASPALTIAETAKQTDNQGQTYTGFLRTAASERVKLKLISLADSSDDETVVRFMAGATTGFDNGYDARKFNSVGVNFSSMTQGQSYAINVLPALTGSETVALDLTGTRAGAYSVAVDLGNGFASTSVYLRDRLTSQLVDLKTVSSYNFNIQSVANLNARFELLFGSSVTNINNNLNNVNVSIYPNPANGPVQLAVSGVSSGNAQVVITNTLGQVVESNTTELVDGKATINHNLAVGIYTATIKVAGQHFTQQLVVK